MTKAKVLKCIPVGFAKVRDENGKMIDEATTFISDKGFPIVIFNKAEKPVVFTWDDLISEALCRVRPDLENADIVFEDNGDDSSEAYA